MKGKDLIEYIVNNDLQDEEFFTNKSILGMMNEEDAAKKFNVGVSTIGVWVNKDMVKGFNMNGVIYIPVDTVDPRLEKGQLYEKVFG